MDSLIGAPAHELARLIRERHVSSMEVVEAHLARIAAVNPALNAVVHLAAESARAQAHRADELLAEGRAPGPLHGVPFTVKDVLEVEGLPCTRGRPERAGVISAEDATVVARLRAAGAIVLGKTNVPPGGSGIETDNRLFGRTNNPYDSSRTPGGSSGGEAAIIAAGGSPLGVGTDSGGSLRLPAHNCGIAALKPTAGRVPTTNGAEVGDLSDPRTQVGLLARSVADLALALPVVAGPDGYDAAAVPVPLQDPAAVDCSASRVAYYTEDGISVPTPQTADAVYVAARVLQAAGLEVEERRPSVLAQGWDLTQRVWESYQGDMRTADVYALLEEWSHYRRQMLGFLRDWDVIVCPVAAGPAVLHGTTTQFRQSTLISFTVPYSLTGWPCVVLRGGSSPTGLPIGVQVVARPWREDVALAVAALLEAAHGVWPPPQL